MPQESAPLDPVVPPQVILVEITATPRVPTLEDLSQPRYGRPKHLPPMPEWEARLRNQAAEQPKPDGN